LNGEGLSRSAMEQVALETIASLPPHIRAALVNIAVTIEDAHPDDPDLYGLYDGIPVTEAIDVSGQLPAHIRIFARPLAEDFPDPEELADEIRITVLHELAHHFGIDEDRLDELGYA